MLEAVVRELALSQHGTTNRHLCPACSADRRHKHDKCLSVTIHDDERAVWNCHHCGWSGAIPLTEKPRLHIVKEESKPVVPVVGPLSVEVIGWLKKRGIRSPGPLVIHGEGKVGFVYPNAIKWRSLNNKRFYQEGAARTLWGLEKVDKGSVLIITEGEIDALSIREIGLNAVSVPNGAPSVVSNGRPSPQEDKKFAYIWNAKAYIDEAPKIILALDADEPGEALAEELARRIGRAKCWRVFWPSDCKDANDVLLRHGKEVLRRCVDEAKPWPVKGLYEADQFDDEIENLYVKGLARGASTGFPNIDDIYTVVPGQVTVVTGSPGSGKSAFIDNVMVNLARNSEWKFAVCSFENPPALHIANMMSIAWGKPFFDGPTQRMDTATKAAAKNWVKEHFFFLHQSDGSLSNPDEIIDLIKAAVMRYGVRGAVIDPYNFIERDKASSETDWVSDLLTKFKLLAMAHDLHIWFIAHPTKLRRRDDGTYPVPTGYDISGSAHFYNKADMGLTVHRPDPKENRTEIHTWKVRYRFTGQLGNEDLSYDVATGVYWSPVR